MNNKKDLFSLPEEITYLNIASQSPAFKTMEAIGMEAILEKSNPQKITTDSYFEPVKKLKKLFSELIQADDYKRIANIPSVSYGMATVAKNIKLNKGDEIVLIEEQFPSNYYVWERLAKENEAKIVIAKQPSTEIDQGKLWNDNILNAISDKTAVVTLGNIHWANGTLFDLQSIREKTKHNNALLIIDGSQSIGALPFSVKEIQPDALICAGYKWLFGPYGCALGYFGPYFDNGIPLEENWTNRLDSENMGGLTNYQTKYKPLANRYSVGEHANFIHTKMLTEGIRQVIEWNPNAIQNYCKEITKEAVSTLKQIGCYVMEDSQRTHHLFGVKLPDNINTKLLKEKLLEEKIHISFRGNYIRLSCHVYNTKNDFKKLTDCILSFL